MRRSPHGFTLVELLVVISIIALLVALLLPALHNAKQVAQRTVCLNTIRQFYIAGASYATDYGEYPCTVNAVLWIDLNSAGSTGGEHAGYTGPTIIPLLLNGGYSASPSGLKCNASAPVSGSSWFAFDSIDAWYCYVGPSAYGGFVGTYGHNAGLQWRSHFLTDFSATLQTDQHYWGCSVRNNWMRLMAVCPTIDYLNSYGMEPHDDQPVSAPPGFDQGGESWSLRRRNALYNDGHAVYWQMDSAGTPADYQ